MNLHFIKAQCSQANRPPGCQFSPNEIKQSYDFEVNIKMFLEKDERGLPIGYEILYKHIKEYSLKNPLDKIITIGGNNSISSATIAAMNDKYMTHMGDICESSLRIIWFDMFPDIKTNTINLDEVSISSLIGLYNPTLVNHKLLIKPSQIMYIGLTDDEDITLVNEYGIEYYTTFKIKQIGINSILPLIRDFIEDNPVHIAIDMKVFDKTICPSVFPQNTDGLTENDIMSVLDVVNKNIVSMDITEFNPFVQTQACSKKTRELARRCLVSAFSINEKTINIYNEDSRFLIYRPSLQSSIDDYGWYLMSNIPLKIKNEIIKNIDSDIIISVELDDEEFLATTTTISEQNNKSYYGTMKITDTTLFPAEKIYMPFELIN